MAENRAAWILAPNAYPLTVQDAPTPKAGPGQVVLQNAAVAINPFDWKIQSYGVFLDKYPFILGQDAAGIIEEVGPGVTRFTKGQRVLAHCSFPITKDPASSAFQLYPTVSEVLVTEIPDSLSFAQAAVLPLAVSTACSGLYHPDYLGLPLPSATDVTPTGQSILIWGGASSVGATTIQLAVASGLSVITTASPPNHDFVKSLGADVVLDYRSATVAEDIASVLPAGDSFIGVYDAIAEESSFTAILSILNHLGVAVPVASVLPYGGQATERFNPKFVMASSIDLEPHEYIGEYIWGTFLPQVLANGTFQAKPDPYVVGHGIEDIQHAFDIQKKGVSAKKVVVTL